MEYKGRCLKKEFQTSPDLANELIGVFLTFRKKTMAFLDDIKKVYFQFGVAEKHRNFLTFSCWKNGDF